MQSSYSPLIVENSEECCSNRDKGPEARQGQRCVIKTGPNDFKHKVLELYDLRDEG